MISLELFNLNKVLDDGKFHIVLEPGVVRAL